MQKGIFGRPSVVKAIEECDRVGAAAFRESYGYGRALDYVLDFNGRWYDSKAIAGVAHRYEYGQALTHDDFSGGRAGAALWLRRIGFVVRQVRNPPWTTDETVLACALVVENGRQGLAAGDPRIVELSALLRHMAAHDSTRGGPFLEPEGVARKTRELAAGHPDRGEPGTTTDGENAVLRAFADRPAEMLEAARRIRELVESQDFLPEQVSGDEPDGFEDDGFEAPEGRLLMRRHLRRERDSRLKGKKIESVLRRGGTVACEICDFDFEQAYGARGAGYIECHHIVPLHVAGESRTNLSDLALICSNCHRMIHRRAPWPTPLEFRAALALRPRIPGQPTP
ncbi:HNH endonuclease [Kitasatospora sp. NPDC057500]|uniref:HNH endonuclease n=1 Tax=Kitasatospora sp. NPDC057500 TaxID=3346151 RepID=UPI0036B2CC2F